MLNCVLFYLSRCGDDLLYTVFDWISSKQGETEAHLGIPCERIIIDKNELYYLYKLNSDVVLILTLIFLGPVQ